MKAVNVVVGLLLLGVAHGAYSQELEKLNSRSFPMRIELYQLCNPERKVADLTLDVSSKASIRPVQRPAAGLSSCASPMVGDPGVFVMGDARLLPGIPSAKIQLVGAIAEQTEADLDGILYRAVEISAPLGVSEHQLGEGEWRYRLVLTPKL